MRGTPDEIPKVQRMVPGNQTVLEWPMAEEASSDSDSDSDSKIESVKLRCSMGERVS